MGEVLVRLTAQLLAGSKEGRRRFMSLDEDGAQLRIAAAFLAADRIGHDRMPGIGLARFYRAGRWHSRRRCTLPVVVIGSASMNSDQLGHFVGRQVAPHVVLQRGLQLGRRARVRLQDDEGLDQRATCLVGHADDCGIGHRGVARRQFSISPGPMR